MISGLTLTVLITNASARPTDATSPATSQPAADQGPYAGLPKVDGAPAWTLGDLAAQVGGGARMTVDPNAPQTQITDEAAALRTALDWLASGTRDDLQRAFRLTGANARSPDHLQALRLLTLLFHNGIGTRPDSGSAIRTASRLIAANDPIACRYVAAKNPSLFVSLAKNCTKLDEVKKIPDATAVKFRGRISGGGAAKLSIDDGKGSTVAVNSEAKLDNVQGGRLVDVAGFMKNGELVNLVGSVPPPHVAYKWSLVSSPVVGGSWQVKRVRVSLNNDGLQTIKKASVKVRCFVNDGHVNDQSSDITFDDLKPGTTKTVEANFEMYNFQYIDAVTPPKAEVTLGEIDW